MLKLTILLRHDENGRRVCELIGEIALIRHPRQYLGRQTTNILNTKYSKQREIITSLFLSKKSYQQIFRELEENGMKCAEPKFAYSENREFVILIDD